MTYFDHAASSPLRPAAKNKMMAAMDVVGNPLSVHVYGRKAKEFVNDARNALAHTIKCESQNILFTSGATESNNQALLCQGADVVLASATEHPSILNVHPNTHLIPVDNNGIVRFDELEKMLQKYQDKKMLVAIMMVNNETGVIQPVQELAKLTKKYNALFHCDAVQALGKLDINFLALDCDTMSFSAHKIGGPQGVGALVVKNHVALSPLIKGGAQERNLRAGTHNLSGIAGFGAAVEECGKDESDRLMAFRTELEKSLTSITPEAVIHGHNTPRSSNIISIGLSHKPSETQVINMDLKGIAISAGSACSSGRTNKRSHVLHAMGLDDDMSSSSVRISIGWNTTKDDIQALASAWAELYGSKNFKKVNIS